MKIHKTFRQWLCLFLFVTIAQGLAAADPQVKLTETEEQWLDSHGALRVSNEMNWAPFNFNERGIPAGYSIDCINLVAEILDIEIEIVSGPTWNEFLKMLDQENLDVILNIAKTSQRSENMLFTIPYSQFSLALFTRTDFPRINEIQDMYGSTLAIPEGFWLEEYLQEYPEIGVLTVGNTEEAIQAVSSGRADGLYDVMPVIQYLSKRLFITNLQVGGNLEIGDDQKVDLRMAVGKDKEILRGILDKGISAISPDDFSELRNKWLSEEALPLESGKDSSAKVLLPIMIIFAGIILVAFLLLLLRRLITKVEILNFHSIWIISIVSLSIFIAIVVTFGWITVNRIDKNLREDLLESLNVVLEATDQALIIFIENNLQMAKRDSENINIITLTESILASDSEFGTQKEAFRDYVSGSLRWLDDEMYQIISPDAKILVSNDEGLEGTLSLISIHEKERFRRVLDGENLFAPSMQSVDSNGKASPLIFFLAPIRDSDGNVVAVLAKSDDPRRDFSSLVRMGHSGRSGETYAFNDDGRMISQSRFESEMIQIGLLENGQSSILNLDLKDPGMNLYENNVSNLKREDLNPTFMVAQASTRIGGQSSEAYRDYRGVPVFSVWYWDATHGFGIATEIDVEEGMKSFFVIRNSTIITLTIAVLLAVMVTLVSLIFGERSNQALSESRSDLEERVNDRTQELSQANRNLNNTIEALTHPFYVIDVKTHKVVLANQAAIQSGNKGASTCYALTHSRDTPCDGAEHECPMAKVLETKRPVQLEHIHNDKDGNPRFAEVHGYPILNEENEVVQMIEYSLDITDRKEAEETTQKHLEELELFNTLTIGREEKMIELKDEINGLLRQMKLPEKYTIVTDVQTGADEDE